MLNILRLFVNKHYYTATGVKGHGGFVLCSCCCYWTLISVKLKRFGHC